MTLNSQEVDQSFGSLIVVSTTLTLLDADQGVSVTADFQYNPQEPYTVQMVLSMPGTPSVTWVFSRDLLRAGLLFSVGIGDVRIRPHPFGVIIGLIHPSGISQFFAFPEPLIEFIGRTLSAVPDGQEENFYPLDSHLAAFFAGPARSAESSDEANSEG